MTRHLTRALASLLISSTVALSAERTVDFSERAGVIRPLNGANGGPVRVAVCGAWRFGFDDSTVSNASRIGATMREMEDGERKKTGGCERYDK